MLESFHLMRPEMLLLFVCVPPLLWLARKFSTENNHWSRHIDARLLSAIQGTTKNTPKVRSGTMLLLLILSLLIISVSGPSWSKKAQPLVQKADNLVVILDLSLSMLAEDTPPSRLVRTKQKVIDLLRNRKEGSTALIAFSGDSFVVTPLTDDVKTVEANLSALDPLIMPVIGSRPELAVKQALDVLKSASASNGRILMLTDGVASHQFEKISDALRGQSVPLNIIAVGTKEGGPIRLPDDRGYLKDKGAVVIPKTDFNALRSLAIKNAGAFATLSLDDSDLSIIDSSALLEMSSDGEAQESNQYDQWVDMGHWFLLLAIPLCLFCYRQGALLLVFILITPEPANAFEWRDLWKTPDQQGQESFLKGDYDSAADLFESPMHKADSLYRKGEYEAAASLYEELNSDKGFYNQGNALAKNGQLENAIAAYDKALDLNPSMQQAIENKALLEKLKEQQQTSQDEGEQQESGEQNDNQNQQNQNQNQQQNQNSSDSQSKEQQSQQESEQQQSQQSDDSKSGQDGEQEQSAEQQSNDASQMQSEAEDKLEKQRSQYPQSDDQSDAKSTEQDLALNEQQQQALQDLAEEEGTDQQNFAIEESLSDEEKRSYEQWMRRVPDDPSGLLRRKFEQQARLRNQESNPEEPLW